MDWLAISGFVATLFFGLLAVYFYLRPIKSKRLSIVYNGSMFFTHDHPAVKITFEGRSINRLERIIVAIFNSGNEPIRSDELVAAEGEKGVAEIHLSKASELLSSSVLVVSGPFNKSSLAIPPMDDIGAPSERFRFEYLNPGDGAVIELLCNNESNSLSDIEAVCDVVGGKVTCERYMYSYRPLQWAMLIAPLAFLVAIFAGDNISRSIANNTTLFAIFVCICTIVFLIYSIRNFISDKPSLPVPAWGRKYFRRLGVPIKD